MAKSRFESRFEYINRIGYNLQDIEEPQLEAFHYNLKDAGLVLTIAEGRSRFKLNMACSEMAKMKNGKKVMDRRDTGFPGRNLNEALPKLIDKYGNVLMLINSGGGASTVPLIAAQEMKKYKEKYGNNDDLKINLITSNPSSPIGKIAAEYGTVLELKGRETVVVKDDEERRRAGGFMGDLFELGSAELLFIEDELLYKDWPFDRFYDIHDKYYPKLIDCIEKYVGRKEHAISEEFNFLIDEASSRHVLLFAGLGSGHDVARTTNVRMGHVKKAVGDDTYAAGESGTPSARRGDILIPILENEEETDRTIAEWCVHHKEKEGDIVTIAESDDLKTIELSDYAIILEQGRPAGAPNRFFLEAAYVLSPLPLLLIDKFDSIGLKIPPQLMEFYHAYTG